MDVVSVLEWVGSISGTIGALLMASKTSVSGWAYPLWILSSVALIGFAVLSHHAGILLQQTTFTAINLLGLWNWMVQPMRRRREVLL